jgi:hypothetical protein
MKLGEAVYKAAQEEQQKQSAEQSGESGDNKGATDADFSEKK